VAYRRVDAELRLSQRIGVLGEKHDGKVASATPGAAVAGNDVEGDMPPPWAVAPMYAAAATTTPGETLGLGLDKRDTCIAMNDVLTEDSTVQFVLDGGLTTDGTTDGEYSHARTPRILSPVLVVKNNSSKTC